MATVKSDRGSHTCLFQSCQTIISGNKLLCKLHKDMIEERTKQIEEGQHGQSPTDNT